MLFNTFFYSLEGFPHLIHKEEENSEKCGVNTLCNLVVTFVLDVRQKYFKILNQRKIIYPFGSF